MSPPRPSLHGLPPGPRSAVAVSARGAHSARGAATARSDRRVNLTAYRVPDADWYKAHPLLFEALPPALAACANEGVFFKEEEFYRPEIRQQWLYGQGRKASDCAAKGVPQDFARNGPIVTNAWSATTSAHGFRICSVDKTHYVNGLALCPVCQQPTTPAACAVDLVPLGPDGKAWTPDDPWNVFIGKLEPIFNAHGLRHFHAPGKQVWDKPHVQLVQWDDAAHLLRL
jgi:hypothetical protein